MNVTATGLDISWQGVKEFLDIQAAIECGFTLKRVRDMTRTYSQNECVYIIMLKIALVLFQIYFLMCKKGISG